MDDRISYIVQWRTERDGEWHDFSGYFTDCKSADSSYHNALENQRCVRARILERVESFEVVTEGGRNDVDCDKAALSERGGEDGT